jgi:hypothetical protein
MVQHAARRAACAGAFAAAIIIAPAVGMSAAPSSGSRTIADVCSQVTTNGSVALQCGVTGPQGGGNYTGGCVTQYGTYQNCLVQEGLPRASGTGPHYRP